MPLLLHHRRATAGAAALYSVPRRMLLQVHGSRTMSVFDVKLVLLGSSSCGGLASQRLVGRQCESC